MPAARAVGREGRRRAAVPADRGLAREGARRARPGAALRSFHRRGGARGDPGRAARLLPMSPRRAGFGRKRLTLGERLRAYLIAGLLVTGPIALTFYLAWLFVSMID